MDNEKLNRMERILDSLSEKMETLVRLEMRHEATEHRVASTEKRVDRHDQDINELRQTARANSIITGATERFGWILVTAVVGVAAYLLRG